MMIDEEHEREGFESAGSLHNISRLPSNKPKMKAIMEDSYRTLLQFPKTRSQETGAVLKHGPFSGITSQGWT